MKTCNECEYLVEVVGFCMISDEVRDLYDCFFNENKPEEIGMYVEDREEPIPTPLWCQKDMTINVQREV